MNLILNNPQLPNLMHNLNNYSSKSKTCNFFRNCWKYLVIILKNICRMSRDQNTSFTVFSYEPNRISSQLPLIWLNFSMVFKIKFLLSFYCLKHHQSIMGHCNMFVCDYNVVKLLNFSFGYKHSLNQLQCIKLTFYHK